MVTQIREHLMGEICNICGNNVATEKKGTVYSAGRYYHKTCWNKIKPIEESEQWTAEDEAVYRPLQRKKRRIDERKRRDKNRRRKFSSRLNSQKKTEETK